jgi:AcrR family transcriptional regulator
MSVSDALAAPQQNERRRLQLLECGLAVFSRKGFTTSRVDDVCTAAQISRATFYRYFENKEDVFDALVDLMSREVLDTVAHLGAVTPDVDGRTTMANWIRDLIAITERWGTIADELIRPREKNPTARDRAVRVTARFAFALADRFTAGGVRDVDPGMAAFAIIAMTERMAHQVRTWNVDIEREAMIDALATMAMKMLHPYAEIAG